VEWPRPLTVEVDVYWMADLTKIYIRSIEGRIGQNGRLFQPGLSTSLSLPLLSSLFSSLLLCLSLGLFQLQLCIVCYHVIKRNKALGGQNLFKKNIAGTNIVTNAEGSKKCIA
jgi:hypothetical protein